MADTMTRSDERSETIKTRPTVSRTKRFSRPIRWVIAITSLAPIGAALGAALSAASSPSPPIESLGVDASTAGPRALSVETIQIEPVSSYSASREYTGTIVARRVSELGFERSGRLESVHVDEGVSVAEGTPLATLDTEHLLTRRRETLARRAQASARLDEMIAGPREEDINAARARVESLEAEVGLLELQTDRSRRLLHRSAVAQEEFDRFSFGLKANHGQLKEARHALEELLNGTRREQIDAQEALVRQFDAALDDIDVDLRKSELKAPFAGTISRRFEDDGTVVRSGAPILKLVENTVLEAWVGLPVEAASAMAVDSLRRVRISGRTFDAWVSGRRPEVDSATRTRTVILQLDATAPDHVVHGQIVRLQMEEMVAASGFWLPITALTEGDRGLWSCLVAVADESRSSPGQSLFRIARRDVELLHTKSDQVLVRGTLNSGDRVVTRGVHRVSVGQLVRISE